MPILPLALTIAAGVGFGRDMKSGFRQFLSLGMAAIILVANGVTGYAAYAAHDDHVDIGHVVGIQADHHHHHDGEFASETSILLCGFSGSCDEEPGEARGHIHIYYFESPWVAPSDEKLNFVSTSEDVPIPRASPPLLEGPSYSLLRPPRATL